MSEETKGVRIDVEVRWGDMDAFQHVNNTLFFRYAESARIAYFEAIDLDSFKESGDEGPALVAANMNFRRQVHYPAQLTVTANTVAMSARSFTMNYVIRDRKDDEVVGDGSSVCVWLDYKLGRAISIPDAMRDAISQLEADESLRTKPGRL